MMRRKRSHDHPLQKIPSLRGLTTPIIPLESPEILNSATLVQGAAHEAVSVQNFPPPVPGML